MPMGPDLAAFRTLGLEPGADPAAVEAAYRRLIKLYHPDRQGGDASRAAEINRAYHHLRKSQRLASAPRATRPMPRRDDPKLRRWLIPGFAAAAVGVVVSAGIAESAWDPFRSLGKPLRYEAGRPDAQQADAVHFSEMPLDSDAIDRAVTDAARIAAGGNFDRLARRSRGCHAALRRNPALTRLDQCVAFDEAVVALMKDDAGSGQFSASAVTGRQLGAARLFTGDYLAMESRLDQIRSHVEFTLAPPDPQPMRRQAGDY